MCLKKKSLKQDQLATNVSHGVWSSNDRSKKDGSEAICYVKASASQNATQHRRPLRLHRTVHSHHDPIRCTLWLGLHTRACATRAVFPSFAFLTPLGSQFRKRGTVGRGTVKRRIRQRLVVVSVTCRWPRPSAIASSSRIRAVRPRAARAHPYATASRRRPGRHTPREGTRR